jgi:hypothetical protein
MVRVTQDFDGYAKGLIRHLGLVDDPHPPTADLIDDLVRPDILWKIVVEKPKKSIIVDANERLPIDDSCPVLRGNSKGNRFVCSRKYQWRSACWTVLRRFFGTL